MYKIDPKKLSVHFPTGRYADKEITETEQIIFFFNENFKTCNFL